MKNYKQYDSRWGKLPYKDLPFNIAKNGCGPTSLANIISSNPKYKKITPKQTRKWLIKRNYVVNGSGTTHAGINDCLKAYGFKVKEQYKLSDLFREMAKGGRRAELLFTGGSRGGVTWTAWGHYVAVSGYKVKNGKHYLYTHDSGPRGNDGWHCYETTMKGLVYKCWTCYLPSDEKKTDTKKTETKKEPAKKKTKRKIRVWPELPKRGFFKTGDKGVNVARLQRLLKKAHYSVGALDGVYGGKTANAVKRLQKAYNITPDGLAGKKTILALRKALNK